MLLKVSGASALTRTKPGVPGVDLDGFKHTNGSLGHAAGDQYLKQVAERIVIWDEDDTREVA